MQLCAVLAKDEVIAAVSEITPLEIEIARQPRRVVALGRPSVIELVHGAGLRLGGGARVTWDVAGLSVPVTVRRWQLLLLASIADRGGAQVLAFDPVLESLELEHVPGFLADRIASAVNEGLSAQRRRLAWNFTKTLSWRRVLPARFSPPSRFELVPGAGRVEVTTSEVRLSVQLRARAAHDSARSDIGSSRTARA